MEEIGVEVMQRLPSEIQDKVLIYYIENILKEVMPELIFDWDRLVAIHEDKKDKDGGYDDFSFDIDAYFVKYKIHELDMHKRRDIQKQMLKPIHLLLLSSKGLNKMVSKILLRLTNEFWKRAELIRIERNMASFDWSWYDYVWMPYNKPWPSDNPDPTALILKFGIMLNWNKFATEIGVFSSYIYDDTHHSNGDTISFGSNE
jgi:hypothetical protein